MYLNYQLDSWIQVGLAEQEEYLLIMKDLEDHEYFPVYFKFYSDMERYQENIISESKLKVIELIRLDRFKVDS